MPPRKRPRRTKLPPVNLGEPVREDLPFRVVEYARGGFIAFRKDEGDPAHLCECARPAVESYLRLREMDPPQNNANPERLAPLESLYFPLTLAEESSRVGAPATLRFAPSLCHRCNVTTPTVRYCHEMYGGQFMQYHGWYVRQTYFRFGIKPHGFAYLSDLCPPELRTHLDALLKARGERAERFRFVMADELRALERDAPEAYRLTMMDEGFDQAKFTESFMADYGRKSRASGVGRRDDRVAELDKLLPKLTRAVTHEVENVTRQEFGFRKVGEGWVSETLMFQLIERMFEGHEVIRHHRPDWLGGLELDAFVPDANVAFEYQGQQHFHSIEAWGGDDALKRLRERDARKAKLCRTQGVALITVDYTEPLTSDHLRTRLDELK